MLDGPRLDRCLNLLSLVCFCWFLSAQSSYWVQCFRRRALPALELGGGGGAPKKRKNWHPHPKKILFFFLFLAPAPPPGSRSSLVCFCWFLLSAQSSYWVQCFRRRALPAIELGGGGGAKKKKKKKLTPPPKKRIFFFFWRPPPPPGSRSSWMRALRPLRGPGAVRGRLMPLKPSLQYSGPAINCYDIYTSKWRKMRGNIYIYTGTFKIIR